jgi:AraC family transcriptional activator of pobA
MEYLYHLPNLYGAIRILGFQHAKSKDGWVFPNHRHNYFEFLHCVSGTIYQWANGERYVLYPGDSLLIKSYSYHHTETPDSAVFFGFHFDLEDRNVHSVFLLQNAPFLDHSNVLASGQRIGEWVHDFTEHYSSFYRQPIELGSGISYESLEVSIRLLQVQSRFLEFIGLLAQLLLQKAGSAIATSGVLAPSQVEIAQTAAFLMEQHLRDGMKVSELSDRLNVHRSYLNQCFKGLYGMAPSNYYQQIRLREAKHLLRTSEHSIEAVSEALGFSSPGHFTQFFKTAVGMTPLHYRKKME